MRFRPAASRGAAVAKSSGPACKAARPASGKPSSASARRSRKCSGALWLGDAVLFAIRSQGRPNHAGIYLGQGLLLHHLENRLAERTTLVFWRSSILTFLGPPA